VNKKQHKFKVGDMVYYIAMDDNMRYTVFASTIIAAGMSMGEWKYLVKHKHVNLLRPEKNLYREIEPAKAACANLNKQEQKNESKNI